MQPSSSPRSPRSLTSGSRRTRRRQARILNASLRFETLEIRLALTGVALPNAGFNPSFTGYTVDEIRAAYGLNSLPNFGATAADGTGQTIAIVDAYNDPNIFTDLTSFDNAMTVVTGSAQTLAQQYGSAASFLTVYNQTGQNITANIATSGANGVPPADPSGSWEGEESLDVEWAHAIAPGAKIDLVESNDDDSSGSPNLETAELAAAALPGVTVISNSWSGAESPTEASQDPTYYEHSGITYLVASGDDGVILPTNGSIINSGYPDFSPDVVAVGGTSLTTAANGSYGSETGWSFSVPNGLTGLNVTNGSAGYAQTGAWAAQTGGFSGTYSTAPAGSADTATWTTPVPIGLDEVSASWLGKAGNATNATYSIYDGAATPADLVGTYSVDQTKTSVGTALGSAQFQYLGDYKFGSGLMTVVLNAATANGTVVADAVGVTLGDAGSGGVSQYEPEPSYQEGFQSTGFRTNPDVSFDADPDTGVAVYDTFKTTTSPSVVGGTSLATPCWAGLIAIVNQGRVAAGESTFDSGSNPTQILQALYALPASDYHDITAGYNGDSAGPGYDLVTGLGSPITTALIPDLVSYGLPATVTGINPNLGPATGGTSVTITGTHFIGTTAVDFGSVAATSFKVVSETEIIAVDPAEIPATVDVTVTTPGGTSPKSAADQFTYIGAPPNNVTATVTGLNISLSWGSVPGAVSYNVYRGTSAGGENTTPYAAGLTTLTDLDTTVTLGVTYYYEVTAVQASGQESSRSAEVNATVVVPPSISPAQTTATAATGGATPTYATIPVLTDPEQPRGVGDELQLTVNVGTLTVPTGVTGVSIVAGANGTNSVTVQGTLAELNDALMDLIYLNSGLAGATLKITPIDPTGGAHGTVVTGSVATVAIKVSVAPVAQPLFTNTPENTPLTINLASLVTTTTDPIDPTTFKIVSQLGNGTLTLSSSGSVLYTPPTGLLGGDSFSYEVRSTAGVWSNVATVVIVVGPTGSLSGYSYVDINNNGIMDPGEVGIEGVSVTIEKTDGSFVFSQTVQTQANGEYVFNNLPAGVYTITETQPGFFEHGQDTAGTPTPAGLAGSGQFAAITLTGNATGVESGSGFNFGELGLRAEFALAYLTRRAFFASSVSTLTGFNATTGDVWVSFDSGISGTLSAAVTASGGGNVSLTLYNNNLQPLVTSAVSTSTAQLTYQGSLGQVYFLEVGGTSPDASLQTSVLNTDLHNYANPDDVNGDGLVTPLDALAVINLLNTLGAGPLAGKQVPIGVMPDVLGNGILSPQDALQIINYLNASQQVVPAAPAASAAVTAAATPSVTTSPLDANEAASVAPTSTTPPAATVASAVAVLPTAVTAFTATDGAGEPPTDTAASVSSSSQAAAGSSPPVTGAASSSATSTTVLTSASLFASSAPIASPSAPAAVSSQPIDPAAVAAVMSQNKIRWDTL